MPRDVVAAPPGEVDGEPTGRTEKHSVQRPEAPDAALSSAAHEVQFGFRSVADIRRSVIVRSIVQATPPSRLPASEPWP